MPEWSEVNHYKDILQAVVGWRLVGVLSHHSRHNIELPLDAPVVTAVRCHGKFLWWETSSGACLANEPMMGGKWMVKVDDPTSIKVDVIFTLVNPNGDSQLVYYHDKDWKKLSKLYWDPDGKLVQDKLAKLGPDLMEDSLPTPKNKDKWTVGKVLLDQSLVAGIGNFIKCEALYICKIHPDTVWGKLRPLAQSLVFCACKHVAVEAYQAKGNPAYGGNYVNHVYGRTEDDQQNPVIKIKTRDGRQSYICPAVQVLH